MLRKILVAVVAIVGLVLSSGAFFKVTP